MKYFCILTLLQNRNCTPTKIELQRRVSGAGACHSVLGGPQGPPSGGGPNSAPPVAVYRGRRNQRYVILTELPEYADFSLAALTTACSCTCRECDEAGFATLAKEHERVNAESARWICHIIQRAQPKRRWCIGMQQRRRMAIVSTSKIQIVLI